MPKDVVFSDIYCDIREGYGEWVYYAYVVACDLLASLQYYLLIATCNFNYKSDFPVMNVCKLPTTVTK